MIYNESDHPTIHNFVLVPGANQKLKPCPFCAHKSVELHNTHTSSYWMECACCGANIHDPRPGRSDSERAHRASAKRAIAAWEGRVGPGSEYPKGSGR